MKSDNASLNSKLINCFKAIVVMKNIILFFCLIICSSVSSQSSFGHSIYKTWFYEDGYTTKQLILKKGNRFHWYFSSCEGGETFRGKFYFEHDTLYLSIRKREVKKLVYRKRKVYSYPGRDNDYPDFEALEMTNDMEKLKFKRKEEDLEFEEVE